ncbi:MAG: hypothetical protein LDLANPLL_01873 [Turneriella sp.]|nr:hypothetical protein [Turneriella sp.]
MSPTFRKGISTTIISVSLLWITNLYAAEETPFDLASDQLEQNQAHETVVYGNTLMDMRQAEKPHFITLVDTFEYARGASLQARGVLFSYRNRAAREVRFIADIPGFPAQAMRRNKYGVWTYFYIPPEIVHTTPQKKIRYKFWVDGLYTVDDTHNQHERDSSGSVASVFHLLHDQFAEATGVFVLDTPVNHGREVLFRIPAGSAETVSVAGDFNQWNPQRDFLTKSEDGYFELRKVISPGKYTFLYRIDGKLVQKIATKSSRTHPVYGRVNFLEIK